MTPAPPQPTWVPKARYPFDSHVVDVAASRVHYVDEGSGPPILFLHGNPTWSFLYRDIVLGLRDTFRCIAVDYPGFGLSRAGAGYTFTPAEHAAAVEGLVTQLDLRDVTVFGQDWGGPIGLTVATRQPDRFRALVLGNTWAWPLNGNLRFEGFSRLWSNPLGRLAIHRANAFVNLMIPAGTSSRLPADVMTAYRAPFSSTASRAAQAAFPAELLRSRGFLQQLADALPAIAHLPALFVWGARDVALRSDAELPRLQQLFPDHETVLLDNAKHYFQEDEPRAVVDAIRAWLPSR